MNRSGIHNGALAQRQTTVAHITIDHSENSSGQLVFFQQATEVEDGVRDSLQTQTRKLAQDGRFIQGFFHRRIAVAETVLHQVHAQHRHQLICRTATFNLWIVRLDQTFPEHHLIHLDQEQLLADLLAFAGVLGVGEGHLLHH